MKTIDEYDFVKDAYLKERKDNKIVFLVGVLKDVDFDTEYLKINKLDYFLNREFEEQLINSDRIKGEPQNGDWFKFYFKNQKIIRIEEKDIFHEIADLLSYYKVSNLILQKLNFIAIIVGILAFFKYTIFLAPLALLSGTIAKRRKQKYSNIGIILGVINLGVVLGFLVYNIVQDILNEDLIDIMEIIEAFIIGAFIGFLNLINKNKNKKN